jgi:hypothetical protein
MRQNSFGGTSLQMRSFRFCTLQGHCLHIQPQGSVCNCMHIVYSCCTNDKRSQTLLEELINWVYLSVNLSFLAPSSALFWQADSCSGSQERLSFYGNRRFITLFIEAGHWTVSWAMTHLGHILTYYFYKFPLLLSSHLCLCLPSVFFSTGFLLKFFMHCLSSYAS